MYSRYYIKITLYCSLLFSKKSSTPLDTSFSSFISLTVSSYSRRLALFLICLNSIIEILHVFFRALFDFLFQKCEHIFGSQLRQAWVIDDVAFFMELLKFQQPFSHSSSPKSVLGFISPENLWIKLIILLKNKVKVFLDFYHIVPIYTVSSNKLNKSMERIFQRY